MSQDLLGRRGLTDLGKRRIKNHRNMNSNVVNKDACLISLLKLKWTYVNFMLAFLVYYVDKRACFKRM